MNHVNNFIICVFRYHSAVSRSQSCSREEISAPGQTKFGIKKYQDQDLKICILSKNHENSTFFVKSCVTLYLQAVAGAGSTGRNKIC
jgi:hypothetical protein